MMRAATVLAAFLLPAWAQAQTQVPHVFEPGQPARASDVNGNFDALSSSVDANSDAIAAVEESLATRLPPVVVDGNGNEIGQLITIGENLWDLMAINQFGYIVRVHFHDGAIGRGVLTYESADCSGTPYALTPTLNGLVETYYDSLGNPLLYYIDKTAVPIANFNAASLSFEGGCEAQPRSGTAWPVSINDPTITGVSSANYPLPIRIEWGK